MAVKWIPLKKVSNFLYWFMVLSAPQFPLLQKIRMLDWHITKVPSNVLILKTLKFVLRNMLLHNGNLTD